MNKEEMVSAMMTQPIAVYNLVDMCVFAGNEHLIFHPKIEELSRLMQLEIFIETRREIGNMLRYALDESEEFDRSAAPAERVLEFVGPVLRDAEARAKLEYERVRADIVSNLTSEIIEAYAMDNRERVIACFPGHRHVLEYGPDMDETYLLDLAIDELYEPMSGIVADRMGVPRP